MSHIDNPPSSDTLLDYFLPQSSIGPIGPQIDIEANMLIAQHPSDFNDMHMTVEDWTKLN
ncbi:10373_t:CDS:2, partial [Funneliformis geosporum]